MCDAAMLLNYEKVREFLDCLEARARSNFYSQRLELINKFSGYSDASYDVSYDTVTVKVNLNDIMLAKLALGNIIRK